MYSVTKQGSQVFEVRRCINRALLNSFASLNFVVLSELYEAKLKNLNPEKVEKLVTKVRQRNLEHMVRDYAHLAETDRSSESQALELNLSPSIQVLKAEQEYLSQPIELLSRQQIVMQHLLDQPSNSERFQQYFVQVNKPQSYD